MVEVYLCIGLMLLGRVLWEVAGWQAKRWLTANDDGWSGESAAARVFLGSLPGAISAVARYRRVQKEQGEPALWFTVFWGGLALSGAAVLTLFVQISRL